MSGYSPKDKRLPACGNNNKWYLEDDWKHVNPISSTVFAQDSVSSDSECSHDIAYIGNTKYVSMKRLMNVSHAMILGKILKNGTNSVGNMKMKL